MTKKEAIEFAKKFGWTKADAERAFADVDLKQADDNTLLLALAAFAGPTLLERQRLQSAQKSQVTQKKNYIEKIETEFSAKVSEYEETLKTERSTFVAVIARVYAIAQQFGLRDPWIDTLLEQYEGYQNDSAQDAEELDSRDAS
jgi:hypothetical protein